MNILIQSFATATFLLPVHGVQGPVIAHRDASREPVETHYVLAERFGACFGLANNYSGRQGAMTIGHIGEDFRPFNWVAEGWSGLRGLAHNALTPFRPKEAVINASDDAVSGSAKSGSHVRASWGLVAADVTEFGDHVDVRVEIPGMSRTDLRVEIRSRQLLVSGEKRTEQTRSEGNVVVTERAFGHFCRAVPLPVEAVADGAAASYEDGVLKVTLKRNQAALGHQVTVN